MFKTFIEIFKQPFYFVISIVVFGVVLFGALLLPNMSLLVNVAFNSGISFVDFLKLIFNLLGSIKSNFTIYSAIYTILISILFGLNVSIVTYYIIDYKNKLEKSGVTTSTFGIIIGAFGIGCASCGSLVLTSFLSLLGIGGSLAFLPFGGQEFGFIGVVLLSLSTYLLLKKISKPKICNIN